MSDISDKFVIVFLIGSAGMYSFGYYLGKIVGKQQEQKHQFFIKETQRRLKAEHKNARQPVA
jgi:hypothetical protein